MNAGLILLTLSYVFSQFFRSFLAVLAEVLERDIGARPDDLATASGVWFLVFALMQIPVGAALDRIGPRRTAAVLFAIGGAGGAAAKSWRNRLFASFPRSAGRRNASRTRPIPSAL